jgi:hypothetical protein
MYKVELSPKNCSISSFNNTQLICSYIYLRKTFNHIYKKQIRSLTIKEKKAIIYDITLFQAIKQKRYLLRCLTPQKWLENWKVFNGITEELKKRELSINYLDFS